MPWLLIDLALVGLALVLLALLSFRLYKQVKALLRSVRAASQVLAPVTSALSQAQAAGAERETVGSDVP